MQLINTMSLNSFAIFMQSPLHIAVSKGSDQLVSLLLKYNANANTLDVKGQTPLKLANAEGQNKCAQLLEQHMGTLD